MLMKLPLVSVRLCSNRGDLDAFGVVAIDDVLEDEEEDDGKTPVSDKEGTESELSEVRVEEKEVEEINPSNLTQSFYDYEDVRSSKIRWDRKLSPRRLWRILVSGGLSKTLESSSEYGTEERKETKKGSFSEFVELRIVPMAMVGGIYGNGGDDILALPSYGGDYCRDYGLTLDEVPLDLSLRIHERR
ncbi:hypothetical protein U1Q18_014479 [Sarracenia purpurea var. burkii]